MIDITRPDNPLIRMTPRAGFRSKHIGLEFELIYGHKCPYCANVITACFKTEEEVNLFPYEETTILSQGEKNKGEVLKTVPNNKDLDSCYRSRFFGKGKDGIQKLTMKNHIMRVAAIEARFREQPEDMWEVGERPCVYTGVFSEREDLLVKDLMLMFNFSPLELGSYNIPKVSELIPSPKGDEVTGAIRWLPALGQAPPVVFMERAFIKTGSNIFLQKMLKRFQKT